MTRVLVTGSTGAVGGGVATRLAAAGVPMRLLVRGDAARAPALPDAEVEVVVGDYGDADALARATRGIRTMLFVSGTEHPDRLDQHRLVARVAAASGVQRVVYTSFLGAAPDAVFTHARVHHHTEVAIEDAGMTLVALRNALYQDLLPSLFDDEGVLRAPAGDGTMTPVARRDVVEVAATTVRDERWDDQRLTLVGPDRLDLDEVAGIVGEVTGRTLRYERETVEQAHASRRRGWPDADEHDYDAWVSTYTAMAAGEMSADDGDVQRVLGRPATDVRTTVAAVHEGG